MMTANAQQQENFGSNPEKCRECLSLYGEPMRQKNYDEALIYWRCVIEICPKYRESIYINGAILYRYMIDKEKDEAKKLLYIDTLMSVYHRQIEHFGRTPEALERYGNDLLRYRQSKPEEAHEILNELIDLRKENSSPVHLMRYYQSLYLMHRNKHPKATEDKMIEEYFRVKGYMEIYNKNNPTDPNAKKAEDAVDEIGLPFLSCDKLVPYLQKQYDALPKDNKDERLALQKKMLEMMNRKNCNDNALFELIVKEVVEADPSHEGYYNLGMIMVNKKKFSDANMYFKKALEICADCPKQEEYLIGISIVNLNSGNLSTAASYARQALTKNPKNGKALILIARAIAGSGCGDDDFQRSFTFILAVEYLQRAKSVDPGVADEANQLISSYRSRFPAKRDAFEHSATAGQKVKVGCWINEETTLILKD
jgi:tetratricopeptide (TPR) repeat protein